MRRVCSVRPGTPGEAGGGAVRGDGSAAVQGGGVGVAERLYVARTCTVVQGAGAGERRSLRSLRDREAYVLLGAPGAGKTVAFQREADEAGGCFVRARDFITYAGRPEWDGRTLFIDGLDEKRAGSTDRRTPLDDIRAKLYALGSPPFRLSCREADWFGAPDRASLSSAVPGVTVDVLRLDPLTDDDVRAILEDRGEPDVDEFLAAARRHGVESWMRNPQALEMLVEAVGDGAWPATRRETFERGCRALGRERNPEHRMAAPQRPSREELLATAGRLCAVLLLTGESEYAVDDDGAGGLLPLTAFEEPSQERIDAVCRTLLFDVRDGRVAPRHRHVAEFLGGRYLAGLVDGTLPVGRVLAHLTGFDGGIVSELRGLAAWLAAFSVKARAEIVDRDPLGVVLYGDLKGFSLAEKKAVIRRLEGIAAEDPASLTQYRETDARWGDLASEDMGPPFAAALAQAGADSAREAVAVVVLESLANGARVPGMAPLLLEAVRDEERAPGIRELALKAYLNQSDDAAAKVVLAKDIVTGTLRDPHDDLLGRLLWDLYPGVIGAEALADFLTVPTARSSGWLAHFWLSAVPRESSREQLETVMDGLLASGRFTAGGDRRGDAHYLVRSIPGRLLWELLRRGGPDVERVFDWLAVIDPWSHVDEAERIRAWFADNPATFQAAFRMSVEREADPDSLRSVGWRLMNWARPPAGFAAWCAAQADAATDARSADRFIDKAAAHWDGAPTWDEIAACFVRRPGRAGAFKQAWEERQERIAAMRAAVPPAEGARTRRERRERRDAVAAQAQALAENRASPKFLHGLARVYYGRAPEVRGADPRKRLLELVGEEDLVETVLRALAMTGKRDDLPTAENVRELASEKQRYYLSLPFMAGLEERGGASDDAELRLALTFLVADGAGDEDPSWYDAAAADRPELVADAVVDAARRALRAGGDAAWVLRRLNDAGHGAVAALAVPALLRSFPTRRTGKLLPVLRMLLRLGLVFCPDAMPDLAEAKLGSKGLALAQRMYWLCAGLATGDCAFVARLRDALDAGDARRVRHVVAFFVGSEWSGPIGRLGADALGLLVRTIGGAYGPEGATGGPSVVVTTGMEAPVAVGEWIDMLAGIPGARATAVLEALGAEASLWRWERRLRHALTAQREARRNAEFRHAGMDEVLGTIDGGPAANAGDVAALTVELLTALARDIRDGSTSDWRLYWKTGFGEPEHEDTCRDRLLPALRRGLEPYGLHGEEEGQYAEDKRSDIKVLGAGGAVPVEIKKSNHPELWTAVRTQLMAKYMRDPKADGHGIYLVLWLGEDFCTKDGTGHAAQNADEVRRRLLSGLTAAERRKLSVVVFDVSRR